MERTHGFAATERAMLKGQRVELQDVQSLAGWFPVAMEEAAGTVWWRNFTNQRFTKPFFQDDLHAQPRDARRVLQTPLSSLAAFGEPGASVPPTAFVFHISRCGSTLLTQMLSALPQNIVMSEPTAVDAFFKYYHAHPGLEDAQQWFCCLIAALGQRRTPLDAGYFVKFDSWHIPWIPFVRQVFPDTPIVFLYRDPVEVLASHQRQRGPQMVPGVLNTSRLQPCMDGIAPADLDAYCLRMLARMLELAVQHAVLENLILVNYRQLPGVLWTELLQSFGIAYTQCELQAIQHRSGFHSKAGSHAFVGDPSPKEACSGSGQHVECDAAWQFYEVLEQRRTGVAVEGMAVC